MTTLIWCERSGDNVYFDLSRFGLLSSFYLKLVNGNVGIGTAKLNVAEFRDMIDELGKKKVKKEPYKKQKRCLKKC